jgi:cyclin T
LIIQFFLYFVSVQELYEQQKELILLGERVVLVTLGFDLNVHHPYKPLVEAIKRFKVAQNALAQVAWNFVNDGYAKITLIYK